jgi:hypothetical protein
VAAIAGVAEALNIAPPPAGNVVNVRLSHYWPALGGVNCFRFIAGECVSPTASGAPWQEWIGRGAACPMEWPFGTAFTLPGGEVFECVDRGGAIRYGPDGIPWIDLLTEYAPVPFGTVIPVKVVFP